MSEKEINPTFNDIRESYGLPRIENKDKEIERLNNIINGIDEILKEHINECIAELNMIMESENFDYVNECSREFDVIRKNIEMIMEKIEELKGSDKE